MITDLALAALLLAGGLVCALIDRRGFAWKWLVVALLLVVLNNVLLASGYGLLPQLIGGQWSWQGKLLALAGTLAIASSPALGWRRSGLTLAQKPGSLRVAIPVALVYCLYPVALTFIFGGSEPNPEAIAFQLTMPGLEEEMFFRGVLLLTLDQAFRARVRLFGVDWGCGAVLSSALFGLVHALSYDAGAFGFDPLTFALTGAPSFVAVWLRYRTGSVLLPILIHNFGNSIGMAIRP
jgi:hypothetical protein